MNLGIRIISQPALWPEIADRLGRLQETLQVDLQLPAQPEPYWKDQRLCLLECAGETNAGMDQIEAAFRQLCGEQATALTHRENELELDVFRSIPELLTDPSKAFIVCSAYIGLDQAEDNHEERSKRQ